MKKPGIQKRPGNWLGQKWRCYLGFSASRSNHHTLLKFICAGSQVR